MEKWHMIIYCPAYNVEKSLPGLLERAGKAGLKLKKQGILLEKMIIVDDGSTDSTLSILKSSSKKLPFLQVIGKKANQGPTAALFDGMKAALTVIKTNGLLLSRTILVRMDTDLEHQPEDLAALVGSIASGKSRIAVGYIPFDLRNGVFLKLFNEIAGGAESKKFLSMRIPQFCPGFNAIRGDLFVRLHPLLIFKSAKFQEKYGMEMLTIDFIVLALAKKLGENARIVKLSPIEDKWIKKSAPGKLFRYWGYHKKTVEFLESLSQE